MPCYYPQTVWRAKEPNPSGKHSLVFNKAKGLADTEMQLPCYKCMGCRIDRRKQITNRAVHEASLHEKNCFPTFTYHDEYLPPNRSIFKKEAQLLIKRLRHAIKPHSVRYYLSGEYGDKRITNPINPFTGTNDIGRPHYHALLFGWKPDDLVPYGTSNNGTDTTYTSEFLTRIWNKGHVIIGNVNRESAGYCTSYVSKKLGGEEFDDNYKILDPSTGEVYLREREFQLQSTKPGIGGDFFLKHWRDFLKGYFTDKGKKYPVPRYYEKLLEKMAYENDDIYPLWEQYVENKRVTFDPENPENSAYRLQQREESANYRKARAEQKKKHVIG